MLRSKTHEPPLVVVLWVLVLHLHVGRQGEERLGFVVHLVDDLLLDAMAGDGGKTDFAVDRTKVIDKLCTLLLGS